MNWCDKSCAGANHPIPAVSGRLGEHTPPLRLPLTNIPRSQKSNHPTCSHPSCAHNDYTQNHGWGEQSTGKCGTQVCLLEWLMKLRKKIDTNTLVPKNVPPNSIDNVEDKGKGGCAKDRKPLQSKKKKGMREGMDPIPVNQKSDTTYRPFHGDAFHNPTGEPQGHLKGASGTGWSTQWYSCVWTGCLDKSSLTGDARPLFTGPKEQQEARLSKQASLTSAPWWLNSLAGQCGMSERLGARRVLESSQGVDWWRGITWGSRGRKDTIGGTPHGYTFFVHGKKVLARVGNWSMNLD